MNTYNYSKELFIFAACYKRDDEERIDNTYCIAMPLDGGGTGTEHPYEMA